MDILWKIERTLVIWPLGFKTQLHENGEENWIAILYRRMELLIFFIVNCFKIFERKHLIAVYHCKELYCTLHLIIRVKGL